MELRRFNALNRLILFALARKTGKDRKTRNKMILKDF